jgi:hypothetical protein
VFSRRHADTVRRTKKAGFFVVDQNGILVGTLTLNVEHAISDRDEANALKSAASILASGGVENSPQHEVARSNNDNAMAANA